mgnify:CR=1 FL=1
MWRRTASAILLATGRTQSECAKGWACSSWQRNAEQQETNSPRECQNLFEGVQQLSRIVFFFATSGAATNQYQGRYSQPWSCKKEPAVCDSRGEHEVLTLNWVLNRTIPICGRLLVFRDMTPPVGKAFQVKGAPKLRRPLCGVTRRGR